MTTTPGLREWFVSNRSAWEKRVEELFKVTQESSDDRDSSNSSDETNTCSICLAEGGKGADAAVKLLHECGHAFHSKCLHTWFRHGNTTCPCCRRVINITL